MNLSERLIAEKDRLDMLTTALSWSNTGLTRDELDKAWKDLQLQEEKNNRLIILELIGEDSKDVISSEPIQMAQTPCNEGSVRS